MLNNIKKYTENSTRDCQLVQIKEILQCPCTGNKELFKEMKISKKGSGC